VKPAPFDYASPDRLEEALELLAERPGAGRALAGGQSLVPLLALRMARLDLLVDLGNITELSGVKRDRDELVIGAMTRQAQIATDPLIGQHAPLLTEATRHIGHFQIRNRGTIGGSLAHADPTAEYPAAALALDAELDVRGRDGARRIPIGELILGPYMTSLRSEELLVSVRIPLRAGRSGHAIEEIARRPGDFALVGGAAHLTLDHRDAIARARVVLFGAGPKALRLPALEDELTGQTEVPDTFAENCRHAAAGLTAPTDAQASGEYRTRVAGPLVSRLVESALRRARNVESDVR
jgi:aerobic carbon-monoxide dehydrogenase medium subunit